MFKNLSQRERLMAIIVATLLPAMLVMFLVFSIGGTLSDQRDQIASLNDKQQELQLRRAKANRAVTRGETYRRESLPSDIRTSLIDYQAWLGQLCESCLGTDNINVAKGPLMPVNAGLGDVIFYRQVFTISSTATIRQVTEFLFHFNEARLLQRVNGFSLTPELEGTGDRARTTGRLTFNLSVEVAALANAESSRDFTHDLRESMPRSLDDYHDIVSRRNLFGPPNEAPKFSTDDSIDLETGETVSVPLKATDDGDREALSYELVESASPEARLEKSGSEFSLQAPALPKGRHQFLVRVTDHGWPSKSDELELEVNVDDPKPVIVKQPDPPPQYARYAFVSGFSTNAAGQPEVWIKAPQPDNQLFRKTVGESFELDGKTWKVTNIAGEMVTIEVDGQTMTFKHRSLLTEPVIDAAGVSSR